MADFHVLPQFCSVARTADDSITTGRFFMRSDFSLKTFQDYYVKKIISQDGEDARKIWMHLDFPIICVTYII